MKFQTTNTCSSQNDRIVKQSHCETVYDHSAFKSPRIELSMGSDLKAKDGLTKCIPAMVSLDICKKQPWEARFGWKISSKMKMIVKVTANQAQNG